MLFAFFLTATNTWAWTVGGVVVDADNEPVEGARVILSGLEGCPHGQEDFRAETETDGDGAFSFEDVETGCYEIHAMAEDLGGTRQRLGLVRHDVNNIRLQLPGWQHDDEFWTVSGVVVDPDGEPVNDAHVMLLGLEECPGSRGFGAFTITDEDGAFSFEDVPTGAYNINAMAEDLGRTRQRLGIVRANIDDIRLELPGIGDDEGNLTVSGIVVDADDAPVEDCHVMLLGLQECPRSRNFGALTITDENGEFSFEDVIPAGYEVLAFTPDLGWARQRLGFIQANVNNIRLQLPGRNLVLNGLPISIEPATLEFIDAEIGNTYTLALTIYNRAQSTLAVTAQRIIPDNTPFSINLGSGEFELEPGSKHVTWVSFSPDDPGTYQAALQIESNEEENGSIEVPLSGGTLSIGSNENTLPKAFSLKGIYPNPFNSSVNLSFYLPCEAHVTLAIYDISGRLITSLIEAKQPAGRYTHTWNAADQSAGIYLAVWQVGDVRKVEKLVLVR